MSFLPFTALNTACLTLQKISIQVRFISVLKPAYINTFTQALAYAINTVTLTTESGVHVGQPNKLMMSISVIGVVKSTKIPTMIRTIFVALRSLLPPGLGTLARVSVVSLSANDRMGTTVIEDTSVKIDP